MEEKKFIDVGPRFDGDIEIFKSHGFEVIGVNNERGEELRIYYDEDNISTLFNAGCLFGAQLLIGQMS